MIKVACAGFPVGKKIYESKLRTVELDDLFKKFPLPQTVEKWKAEAPENFDFIVCAPRSITHETKARAQHSRKNTFQGGALTDTAGVRQAYAHTLEVAEKLRSRLVLFQLPSQFMPQPQNIQRVQKFFSQKRGHIIFAWEPPDHWPINLVDDLSEAHRIMPVMNPLGKLKPTHNSPLRYYRLGGRGKTSGTGNISETDMKLIKNLCDTPLSYVIFNNGPTAFQDAVRFNAICST